MNAFIRSQLRALLLSSDALESKHIEALLHSVKEYSSQPLPTAVTNGTDGKEVTALYSDSAVAEETKGYAWATVTDKMGRCMITAMGMDLIKGMDIKTVSAGGEERKCILVKFEGIKKQQNNGGEMVAILIALRIASKYPAITHINSDSELLVKWWSKGHIRKDTREAMDPKKIALLDECVTLRKAFEARGGTIVHISGDYNPADLGFHKG